MSEITITLAFRWWVIPAVITAVSLLWAFFWPADDGGYLGGITRLFMLIPALGGSLLAWAVAGILK